MSDLYLWVKTLHIVMVTSWFAGMFYLPRIFVNIALADADPDSTVSERARLLLMARKLYRFMGPLMVLAIVFGLILWLYFGIGFGAYWMPVKFVLVLALTAYHGICGRMLRQMASGPASHSHIWFRWFNEVPVIGLLLVVILVVFKPF